MKRYLLNLSQDDKDNLLKIIENGEYKGSQVEYVVLLKNKILNAPENCAKEAVKKEEPKEK